MKSLKPAVSQRNALVGVRSRTCHSRVSPFASAQKSGQSAYKYRLVLLRHADSADTSPGVRDHDRPLSEQGKSEASSIAIKIRAAGWLPDLIVASNAKRTKETLNVMGDFVSELNDVDAHYFGSLYTVAALDGQTREYLERTVSEVTNTNSKCVMCVGHNKGWEEAATQFAGKPVKLKTANAALFQCTAPSWKDALREGKWDLVDVLTPN